MIPELIAKVIKRTPLLIDKVALLNELIAEHGVEAYWAAGIDIANKIKSDIGDRSILYMPIKTGASKVGEPLEVGFKDKKISITYTTLPIFIDRDNATVLRPTIDELMSTSEELKIHYRKDVVGLLYDDVIASGWNMLAAYRFLKSHKDKANLYDIKRGCLADFVGISHYCWLPFYKEPVDVDKYILTLDLPPNEEDSEEGSLAYQIKRTVQKHKVDKKPMIETVLA